MLDVAILPLPLFPGGPLGASLPHSLSIELVYSRPSQAGLPLAGLEEEAKPVGNKFPRTKSSGGHFSIAWPPKTTWTEGGLVTRPRVKKCPLEVSPSKHNSTNDALVREAPSRRLSHHSRRGLFEERHDLFSLDGREARQEVVDCFATL